MAFAVIADAGPMPNAVVAVITETADNLLTPIFNKIGNKDHCNNPKPAADGIAINRICPSGITKLAAK